MWREIRRYCRKVFERRLRQDDPPSPFALPRVADPLVSIIVPAYNHFTATWACLRSIADHTEGGRFEVILADDGSTDETANIGGLVTNLAIERAPENRGFLLNCNRAVLRAEGKYLVFLNNDARVTPGWLGPLLRVAERDARVGVVGAKLVYPDGRLQEAGGIIWNDARGLNYGKGDDPDKPEYCYLKEVDYVSGAAMLVRKQLWEEAGGFDERFAPAYYEDADLAFTARQRGFKVVYQPASLVVHEEGTSHGTDDRTGGKRHQAANRGRFLDKWRATLEREHPAPGRDVFRARDRSRGKKHVLVVDHYVPRFDRDAGSRSAFHYLRWFAEEGLQVTLVGDDFAREEPYTSAVQQLGIEVLYGRAQVRGFRRWLREHGRDIDYCWLHRPAIAAKHLDTIRACTGAKVVYAGCDLHYLRTRRQFEVEGREALRAEADRWQRTELEVVRKSDVAYFPSEVEVEEVRRHVPDRPIRAIPLFILDRVEPASHVIAERHGLLFVGGFHHAPNVDGALWFCGNVLPLVREHLPDIRVTLVGSSMPDAVRRLASNLIAVQRDVSDSQLEASYRQCRLVVAPLRYGAGVKGKVLEALQHQVPVVTTSIGAEGLPAPVTSYLAIADDARSFAREVVDLYTGEARWVQHAERGRDVINRHFSRQRACDIVSQDLQLGCRDGAVAL